jgi:ribosomal protein S18 acetylase RimI-like enzyme
MAARPYSPRDDARRLMHLLAQGRPYESWVLNPSYLPADPALARAWEGPGGELLGAAVVLNAAVYGSFLFLAVHPTVRGLLEPAMLAWARETALRANPAGPTLLCRAEEGDACRIRLLETHGFARQVDEDQFYMECRLAQEPPVALPAPGYTLRPFTGADAADWVALWDALWDEGLLPDEHPDWRAHPSYVPALDLVACAPDGTLAGLILGNLFRDERGSVEPDGAWLLWLGVEPAHRRQGLGRALMQAALREMWARGCRRILLNVDADNRPAVRLYERCGFRVLYRLQGRVARLSE